MPFNGSGTFNVLITFIPNTLATGEDQNAQDGDIAAGLTNCLTKDGQSTPTANLSLGGFQINELGTGTLVTDGVNYGQIYPLTQPGTVITPSTANLFYQQNGAIVNRMNDRILLGAATVNSGNATGVGTQDWLQAIIPDTTSISQFTSLSTIGAFAGIFGTRTSDAPTSITQSICLGGFGINDNTTVVGSMTVYYGETRHYASATSVSIGFEFDSIPLSGAALGDCTPYNMFQNLVTANHWFSFGRPDVASADSSVGLGFINNAGAAFATSGRVLRGIVFDATVLIGATGVGTSGFGTAISMAAGHAIVWYNTSQNVAASIISQVQSHNSWLSLVFANTGLFVLGGTSGNLLLVTGVQAATTGLNIIPTATTVGNVTVSPISSLTNADLFLEPQGAAGYIGLGCGPGMSTSANTGSASALPADPVFYYTFRFTNDGNLYKIPVYNV